MIDICKDCDIQILWRCYEW